LYLEVHPSLQEDTVTPPTLTDLTRLIVDATRSNPVPVDWSAAERAWLEARGIPVRVSVASPARAE
jgi:hypothetical protein